jgi:succinate dehydrogenase/fumarate reductase flavoprotein subunit
MITIKMYEDEWRIIIGDEVWNFRTLELMKQNLNSILEIKDNYGRINNSWKKQILE